MSQKKISELESTVSLNDTDIFPLVQYHTTKHIKYSDLKAPLVKEVEANVEDYVDNKLTTRVNFETSSMVGMGFSKNSYVSVRDFWNKLYSRYGNNSLVHFWWSSANQAYVGNSGNYLTVGGGTLIYSCNGLPSQTWKSFSAIYFDGYDGGTYHIKCSVGSDTTAGKENWSITKLADNADILSVRSSLSDVSGKLDYMYNRYPSQGKVIGKWHDGRNIWRVVYLAKDLTVTSAQVGNGSLYGFIGGLTKQRDVGLVLSAKVHRKSGAALEDMEVFLAHDDCIFTNGTVNTSVSTENVDCLIVEFVEK